MKWVIGWIIGLSFIGVFLLGAHLQSQSIQVKMIEKEDVISLKVPKTQRELNLRIVCNSMEKVMLEEMKKLEKGGRFPIEKSN